MITIAQFPAATVEVPANRLTPVELGQVILPTSPGVNMAWLIKQLVIDGLIEGSASAKGEIKEKITIKEQKIFKTEEEAAHAAELIGGAPNFTEKLTLGTLTAPTVYSENKYVTSSHAGTVASFEYEENIIRGFWPLPIALQLFAQTADGSVFLGTFGDTFVRLPAPPEIFPVNALAIVSEFVDLTNPLTVYQPTEVLLILKAVCVTPAAITIKLAAGGLTVTGNYESTYLNQQISGVPL